MSNSPTVPTQLTGAFNHVNDLCVISPSSVDAEFDRVVSAYQIYSHDDRVPRVRMVPTDTSLAAAIAYCDVDTTKSGLAIENAPYEVSPAAYFRIKSGVDRCLAAGLIVVALPAFVIVGLTALAVQGRPIFYRQARVGKEGRIFRIWKFRTMRTDAESASGAVWSIAGDPRVTRLGSLLRCSHLDELPQLINVLKGEMDLVGPRPERPEFVQELSAEFPLYSQRLLVKPGISGLAQLKLGYDVSVADVDKKLHLDLEYIRCASLRKDLSLLLQTIPYIMRKMWSSWRTSKVRNWRTQSVAVQESAVREMIAAKQIRRSRLDTAGAAYRKANHLAGVAQSSSPQLFDRI